MSLETKIMEQIKEAMKAKNSIALEALRAVKSELQLLETSGGKASVSEAQEIALLQKLIKQRKEAAEHFSANDRKELAEKEIAQADIIQAFLPEQFSEEELTLKLQEIIDQIGANSPQDMGKVMGMATAQFAGKAEGKMIAATVKKLLSTNN
ncbi:MAG TPA: GatB/YqeY domain-containing protein [Moheibacter sp.]|nr:GatB/YqeY domain-containing protein [Moheibacter sp.]